MARAGLRWKVDDLTERAKVSKMSVNRLEGDVLKVNHATQEQIRRTFEKVGVEFLDGDGVRIP